MDNKKDAQAINRQRARRRFNVPDEPTWNEQAVQTIQSMAETILTSLLGGSKTKSRGVFTFATVILAVIAIAVGIWWSRAYQRCTSVPEIARLDTNSTGLMGVQWDLMPFEQ